MIPLRTFLCLAVITVALTTFAAACGGGSSKSAVSTPADTQTSTSGTPIPATPRKKKPPPTPTPTAMPLLKPGLRVRDLVQPPDADGFEATFAWKKGIPTGATGLFVWRQGHGSRRFDFSAGGAKNPASGWSSLEIGATSASLLALSPSVSYCLWFGEQAGQVKVTCGPAAPSSGLTDALFLAMNANVTGTFADRSIAGRAAKCYSYDEGAIGQGALCVDPSTREPLYFAGKGSATTVEQEIEATNVLTQNPGLSIPAGLPGDVGIPNAVKIAVSALQYPSAITWDH